MAYINGKHTAKCFYKGKGVPIVCKVVVGGETATSTDTYSGLIKKTGLSILHTATFTPPAGNVANWVLTKVTVKAVNSATPATVLDFAATIADAAAWRFNVSAVGVEGIAITYDLDIECTFEYQA